MSRQMIDAGFGRHENTNIITEETPEPPKDYAPKVPGGILSEEYGLKEDTAAPGTTKIDIAPDTADTLADDEEDPTLKVS